MVFVGLGRCGIGRIANGTLGTRSRWWTRRWRWPGWTWRPWHGRYAGRWPGWTTLGRNARWARDGAMRPGYGWPRHVPGYGTRWSRYGRTRYGTGYGSGWTRYGWTWHGSGYGSGRTRYGHGWSSDGHGPGHGNANAQLCDGCAQPKPLDDRHDASGYGAVPAPTHAQTHTSRRPRRQLGRVRDLQSLTETNQATDTRLPFPWCWDPDQFPKGTGRLHLWVCPSLFVFLGLTVAFAPVDSPSPARLNSFQRFTRC